MHTVVREPMEDARTTDLSVSRRLCTAVVGNIDLARLRQCWIEVDALTLNAAEDNAGRS